MRKRLNELIDANLRYTFLGWLQAAVPGGSGGGPTWLVVVIFVVVGILGVVWVASKLRRK